MMKRHNKYNNDGSKIHEHIQIESGDPECEFEFSDIKILDSCPPSHDLQLKFIESIILKFEKQTLNTCERSIPLTIV